MLKIKDNPDLIRDPISKAIISIDETGYETYLKKRESNRIKSEQLLQNSKDIESLKNDMSEIKKLLVQLLEK